MTPEERERYRVLIRELHMISRGIVGLTQDIVRTRTFREQRDVLLSAIDHAGEISEALEPLALAQEQDARKYQAELKARVRADLAERQRLAAEQSAAARERARREHQERLVRELA